MTQQAKCAHVRKVALAAAFGDGHNVVGIPERFAAAFPQLPMLQEVPARRVVQLAHIATKGYRVFAALRADALISLEDLVAEIGGVRA